MKKSNFALLNSSLSVMKNAIWTFIILIFNILNISAQTLQEGIRLMENENYNAALQVFSKLNATDPKNPIYPYYIGEVHYALENFDAAATSYNAGLAISSKCDECRIGLGRLDLDKGKIAEAKKHFESALKGNAKNHKILSMVGDAWLYGQKAYPDEALEYFIKARDLDPKVARYWTHLGDAQYAKKDLGSAMTAYETAIEKDKNDPETYVKMARIWGASKKYDLGIEKLEIAIAMKPDYALAYKELYEQLIKNKNFSKVLPVLEKYVSLTGDDVDAKVRLVKFLCFQARDYDRAIAEGLKVLESNPTQYTLHRWLAWSYGELDKAQESYDQSVKLFSVLSKDTTLKSFPSDYEYFAKAAIKLKKFEEAEFNYLKVAEMDPDRAPEIYSLLGKSYYDAKIFPKATEWYMRKGELQPLINTEQYYLGLSLFYEAKYLEADSSFTKVVTLTPNYAQGWLMRARCNTAMDSAQAAGLAKPFYEKYAELTSVEPDKSRTKKNLIESYKYLGAYYVQRDDNNQALIYFEQIAALDPADKDAADAIKILKKK